MPIYNGFRTLNQLVLFCFVSCIVNDIGRHLIHYVMIQNRDRSRHGCTCERRKRFHFSSTCDLITRKHCEYVVLQGGVRMRNDRSSSYVTSDFKACFARDNRYAYTHAKSTSLSLPQVPKAIVRCQYAQRDR